jgi:hypothetical protein
MRRTERSQAGAGGVAETARSDPGFSSGAKMQTLEGRPSPGDREPIT